MRLRLKHRFATAFACFVTEVLTDFREVLMDFKKVLTSKKLTYPSEKEILQIYMRTLLALDLLQDDVAQRKHALTYNLIPQ